MLPADIGNVRAWLKTVESRSATFTAAPDFANRRCMHHAGDDIDLSSLRVALNAAPKIGIRVVCLPLPADTDLIVFSYGSELRALPAREPTYGHAAQGSRNTCSACCRESNCPGRIGVTIPGLWSSTM